MALAELWEEEPSTPRGPHSHVDDPTSLSLSFHTKCRAVSSQLLHPKRCPIKDPVVDTCLAAPMLHPFITQRSDPNSATNPSRYSDSLMMQIPCPLPIDVLLQCRGTICYATRHFHYFRHCIAAKFPHPTPYE